jgi:hypothetical protein
MTSLRDAIEAVGITAYVAEHDSGYGRSLSAKIMKAIDASDVLVAVFTKAAPSASVNQEVGYAKGKAGKTVIPMVEEGAKVGIILGDAEQVRFTGGTFSQSCDKVAWHLKAISTQVDRSLKEEQIAQVKAPAWEIFALTVLLSTYAIFRPVSFVFSGNSAVIFGFLDSWSILAGLLVLAAVGIFSRYSLKKTERFLIDWPRVPPFVLALCVVWTFAVFVLLVESGIYPTFFQIQVEAPWQALLAIGEGSVLLSGASFLLVETLFPKYFRELVRIDPEFRVRRVQVRRMKLTKSFLSPWRSKRFMPLLIAILIFAAIVQPVEARFSVFTPGVQTTVVPNTLKLVFNGYYNASYLVSISSIATFAYHNSSQPSNCNASFFQSFNETLRIRVPLLYAYSINNITVANPSNISIYPYPSLGSTYYYNPYSVSSWQTLWVTNYNHTSISTLPTGKPVQALEIGLSNKTRGTDIMIGLRYFEPVQPTATCTEADHYYRHSNSTLIVHQFEIVNNGPSAIGIDSVIVRDFSGLNIYPSNVTLTINGRSIGITSITYDGYPNSDYSLWDYPIMPHTNVTLIVEGISKIL